MIQQSPTERADELRVNPVRIGDEVHLFIAGLSHTVGLTRAEAVQLARFLDTASQAAQPAEAGGVTPPAPNDDLRAALEWIDYHKDNQDMNHVNFRIGAGSRARDALAALKENRRG